MDDQATIAACKKEIDDLKLELQQKPILVDAAKAAGLKAVSSKLKARRTLKGHFGKVYCVSWAPNSRNLLSVSQDGKMILWNAFTSARVASIPLTNSWTYTCAYSGTLAASGGLGNVCQIFSPKKDGSFEQSLELKNHEGYISTVVFPREDELLTGSGDTKCILWDVERGQPKSVFPGDQGEEINGLSVFEPNGVFLASNPAGVSLWDHRQEKKLVRKFPAGLEDVACVSMFPDGTAFGVGDEQCRLFDLRTGELLNKYAGKSARDVSSCCFSSSGRLLHGAFQDGRMCVWDTQLGGLLEEINAHEGRMTTVTMSKDGQALATASWDPDCKIWA